MAEPSPWQRPEPGTTPPSPAAPLSPMPIEPHPGGERPGPNFDRTDGDAPGDPDADRDGGDAAALGRASVAWPVTNGSEPHPGSSPRHDGPGFGDPVPVEDARPDRRTRWIAAGVGAALVAVLIVVLGWAGIGPASPLHADSGVQACKDVAAGDDAGDTRPNAGDVTMSPDDYRWIRGQFQGSRFADIRGSGTHFVDVVWQIGRMFSSGGDPLAPAIAYAGEVFSAYSDLSGACANHGVTLPPLDGN